MSGWRTTRKQDTRKQELVSTKRPVARQKTSSSQASFWLAMALVVVVGIGVGGLAMFIVLRDERAPSATPPGPAPRNTPAEYPAPSSVSGRPGIRAPTLAPPLPDSASAETSVSPFVCTLRITSMTRFGPDNVVVGVEDRLSRKTQMLRIGDPVGDGWNLAAVDFERESVDFEQNGIRHTAFLEKGLPSPAAAPEDAPRAVADGEAREENPVVAYTVAFSNRVLTVEGDTEVVVSGVAHAPDVVEVKTPVTRFALRRELVEDILKLDTLTPEQKLQMLLTYPGAAIVEEGQDPARQAADAEAVLAATLANPPGEKPSVEELEELDRLAKELPEIEAPPDPAKTPKE